jgi:hypothetical protein
MELKREVDALVRDMLPDADAPAKAEVERTDVLSEVPGGVKPAAWPELFRVRKDVRVV